MTLFMAKEVKRETLILVRPTPIPLWDGNGPRTRPQDWKQAKLLARELLTSAPRNCPIGDWDDKLFDTYAAIATRADRELSDLAGQTHSHERRAREPVLKRVSVEEACAQELQQERQRVEFMPHLWLRHRWAELRSITDKVRRFGPTTVDTEHLQGLAEELRQAPFHGDMDFQRHRETLEAWTTALLLDATADALAPEAIDRFLRQVESLAPALAAAHRKEQEASTNASTTSWRTWSSQACEKGASKGHRWARPQKAWEATASAGQDPSGLPVDLLAMEAQAWGELWGATKDTPILNDAFIIPGPPITPSQLRAASRRFRRTTAQSLDGFHPSHYQHISDEGLQAIADLLSAIEARGVWPRQLRFVQIVLIPKPKGGFRPIGLMSSLYRLWGALRRPVLGAWEATHKLPIFAFGAGRSALSAVWRVALEAEKATTTRGKAMAAATLLVDLHKYYELLDHDRLIAESERHDIPPWLARPAVHAYKHRRIMTMRSLCQDVGHAKRGAIAGCFYITTGVQCYARDALTWLAARHPAIRLRIYLDDFTMQCCHAEEEIVRAAIVDAATDLDSTISATGSEISCPKTQVVASTDNLKDAIVRALGVLVADPTASEASALCLGVSISAGKKRKTFWKASASRQRMQAHRARAARTRRLKAGGKEASHKVYAAGACPAATYGTEVLGASNEDDLMMRRTSASLTGGGKGKRLSVHTVMFDKTSWRATAAPILHVARAMWELASGGAGSDYSDYCVHPATFRAMWEALCSSGKKKRWAEVAGPFGACLVSMQRLGWHWNQPFSFADEHGIRRTFTDHSPASIAALCRRAYCGRAQKQVNLMIAGSPDIHVTLGPVKKLLAPSSALDRLQKGCLVGYVSGAIWPKERLAAKGLAEDTACILCGQHDDMDHRLYSKCSGKPADPALRRKLLPPFGLSEVQRQVRKKGFLSRPAFKGPTAEDDMLLCFDIDNPDVTPSTIAFSGDGLYGDGSADQLPDPDLNRAGWSVVQVDGEGKLVKAIAGPVPARHPQTSVAAEHHALAGTCMYSQGELLYHGDNKGVTDGWTSARATGPRSCYAGISRVARAHGEGRVHTTWVKAHVDADKAGLEPGTQQWLDAKGNEHADTWAAKGRLLHPQQATGAIQAWSADLKCYTEHLEQVACALAVWASSDTSTIDWRGKSEQQQPQPPPPPPRGRQGYQHPRFQAVEVPPLPGHTELCLQHRWRRHRGATQTRCTQCLAVQQRTPTKECQPHRHWVFKHDFSNHEVAVWRSECGSHLWACLRCGGWAEVLPRMLQGYCLGTQTPATARDLSRISSGCHPRQHAEGLTPTSWEALAQDRLDAAVFEQVCSVVGQHAPT